MIDLRAWAKSNQPILGFVISAITIVSLVGGAIRYLFAPPPVAVTLETSEMQFPWYLYDGLRKALDRDSAVLTDSSGYQMRRVRGFLRDTKTYTRISIRNTTEASIQNVDLRLRYVSDLDGWGVESDELSVDERRRLMDSLKYDPGSRIVTLSGVPRLPPKSSIRLSLWGDVSFAAVLRDEQISVTYDGGTAGLVNVRTVEGLDAFVYDNAALLIVVLLLLNYAAWELFIQKRVRARPKNATPEKGAA